ncbi:putative pectinesterase/pectinesterase inhibitor 25 [Aphanomyces euteiches]|nr:putative pectinesterase/pectinesterase inhibitor 25 [Aphanomyces euteiches]
MAFAKTRLPKQCISVPMQCISVPKQCISLSIQSTTTCLVCSSPAAFHSPAQHLDFLSRWHQCNKTNIM